ncbi:YciI family protein [Microbulbifer hainanensis]|uniref:YciI family protein n=1 Tax=Microbulbifer hainanensis TaxID=2735675 RepID=UPI001868EAE6|nr:YciI family protein [Microbulbifer hainanensis]
MKYLCLSYEEEEKFRAMSPAELQALRAETLAFVEALRTSGQLLATETLQSACTAATLHMRDHCPLLSDGPFAETREQLDSFFLIEAQDFNEAIRIASQWPTARFGTIEIRPVCEDPR